MNVRKTVGRAALVAAVASASLGAAWPERAPRAAATDHVIIISLDGLRPDAIEAAGAETLRRLVREGSASMAAQTIYPSKTLPSHTSMLTGVGPDVHGITWNSDRTDEHGVVDVPTVFDLASERGLRTAAFFSKSKFHHLIRPGSFDHAQAPDGAEHFMATRTVGDAVTYLQHETPSLLFVHIAETDYAGHSIGWMSFAYRWAVRRADGAVATLLDAADEAFGEGNYTVIVTADHGGHGRTHGTDDPSDMTIPWIAWGKGVQAGQTLSAGIRTMDTAATALWLLGVPVPAEWQGRPVVEAFSEQTRVTAMAEAAG